ncbi:hypothetical protein BC826DRAFT_1142314, partial [Russula brevipes]
AIKEDANVVQCAGIDIIRVNACLEGEDDIVLPNPATCLRDCPRSSEPDWTLLRGSNHRTYQSREALEQQNQQLTDSLARSQDIICTHELIDEGRAAQLLIQNMILIKQNKALHAKENKKDEGRTKLFANGFGRHLTDSELIQTTAMERQKKLEKEVEKAKRKLD